MALLIDIKQPVWMRDDELRDQLLAVDPQADIRCADQPGDPEEIEMLAVSTYEKGEALRYPNLRLVQKTGAGVESILVDDSLPEWVQVARLSSDVPGREMAEYSLACVLQVQRHLRQYAANQLNANWSALAPRRAVETTIAVLGLGRIGTLIAQKFVDNDFRVLGWSRRKNLSNIECFHGMQQLPELLAKSDYVICILPSTPETFELFKHERFVCMKPGSYLINIGRGTLVNEVDLVQALDRGMLGGAVLDVMQSEPLDVNSPLWSHTKVLITPHVSGWHLGDAVLDIAENYRRLATGEAFINLIDRQQGY